MKPEEDALDFLHWNEQVINIQELYARLKQLTSQNSRLARENYKLRQHLNRCRKDDDQHNWLESQKYMRNPQNMITRLQYYVRAGHSRFAIWITDLENFPCISWLFEVN